MLRRNSPETLVSLVLTKPFPSRSFLANQLLRLGLSFRIIDHVLIGQANVNFGKHGGIEQQRIAIVDSNRTHDPADLLRQRLDQEQKSVLWVDQSVTSGSPSMRGLVESLPSLRATGGILGRCVTSYRKSSRRLRRHAFQNCRHQPFWRRYSFSSLATFTASFRASFCGSGRPVSSTPLAAPIFKRTSVRFSSVIAAGCRLPRRRRARGLRLDRPANFAPLGTHRTMATSVRFCKAVVAGFPRDRRNRAAMLWRLRSAESFAEFL